MSITRNIYGTLKDGGTVYLYEMVNKSGMRVSVTNYGCAVVSLWVPDKTGQGRDIVFGFDTLAEYEVNPASFGVVVGRFANRIKNGTFELDGKTAVLEKNDGNNHLHGGLKGFSKQLWEADEAGSAENKLTLTHFSPDGSGGYPGNLTARVTYTLTENNSLRIDYTAETDTKTIANLTNHSYFNLEGHDAKNVYGHELQIGADKITCVDDELIPTGELADITGTPFDFREAKPIGRDLQTAGGYDHNFVLNGPPHAAARVYSPVSGIVMEVRTDSPGMQLYTGNFLDGSVKGKGGVYYPQHGGFCLETQIFPDAIHHPHFPSCVVTKDTPQRFFTEFAFSVRHEG